MVTCIICSGLTYELYSEDGLSTYVFVYGVGCCHRIATLYLKKCWLCPLKPPDYEQLLTLLP